MKILILSMTFFISLNAVSAEKSKRARRRPASDVTIDCSTKDDPNKPLELNYGGEPIRYCALPPKDGEFYGIGPKNSKSNYFFVIASTNDSQVYKVRMFIGADGNQAITATVLVGDNNGLTSDGPEFNQIWIRGSKASAASANH